MGSISSIAFSYKCPAFLLKRSRFTLGLTYQYGLSIGCTRGLDNLSVSHISDAGLRENPTQYELG